MKARVEAIARVRDALAGEASEALFAASAQDSALHPWVIEEGWRTALARFSDEALAARVSARWAGRHVSVVLGRSVVVAPWRAMVLPLLEGAARVTVKPSRAQGAVPRFLAARLAEAGLPVGEGPFADADVVIAYGSDAGLRAIATGLPPSVTFLGHGHGLGVALWGHGVTDDEVDATALDIARFDQQGCLSPQAVLVCGAVEVEAARLSRALERVALRLPRRRLDPGAGAALAQWAGRMALKAERVWRGTHSLVVACAQGEIEGSPGDRAIAVIGVEGPTAACSRLAPHAPHLTVLGCAGQGLEGLQVPGFTGRTVRVGAMQDPPFDGPEDRRGA